MQQAGMYGDSEIFPEALLQFCFVDVESLADTGDGDLPVKVIINVFPDLQKQAGISLGHKKTGLMVMGGLIAVS